MTTPRVQPHPSPAQDRLAAFDNPSWHVSIGCARWVPPPPCLHPADRVLGPCGCHYHPIPEGTR